MSFICVNKKWKLQCFNTSTFIMVILWMIYLETIFFSRYMHIPVTLWRFTISLNFVLFFFFLPAHHTSSPFFTETGYVFGHKLRSLRWRRSQVWSDVARRRAMLWKSTESIYYLLSKVSKRVSSWPLQSWLIRRICAMFLEQNITIYNGNINEVEE